jgi:PIN domain nuclease of toxin-antitoxin system
MEYLVDTQALIWWDTLPERIGPEAFTVFSNQSNVLYASHASIWEMAIKTRLGKLTLPLELNRWLEECIKDSGFILLPISLDDILYTQGLALHHGDPFDRLLVAQALVRSWPVLSSDSHWGAYGVQRIW